MQAIAHSLRLCLRKFGLSRRTWAVQRIGVPIAEVAPPRNTGGAPSLGTTTAALVQIWHSNSGSPTTEFISSIRACLSPLDTPGEAGGTVPQRGFYFNSIRYIMPGQSLVSSRLYQAPAWSSI